MTNNNNDNCARTVKKSLLISDSLMLASITTNANAQSKSQQSMSALIDEQMKFAKEQYKVLAKNVPVDRMPKALKDDKVVTSDTKWWCSGFFPGSLLYIYEYTNDAETRAEAQRRLDILQKEKHYTGNHDLGYDVLQLRQCLSFVQKTRR